MTYVIVDTVSRCAMNLRPRHSVGETRYKTAAAAKAALTRFNSKVTKAALTNDDTVQVGMVMSYDEYVKQRPMKRVKNLMSGKEIEIPADTPACCDPSTETYWSM